MAQKHIFSLLMGWIRCLLHLPTEILYDAKGLQLFEDITFLEDEYYLTACERAILQREAHSIGACIPDNASVIELGCSQVAFLFYTGVFACLTQLMNRCGKMISNAG